MEYVRRVYVAGVGYTCYLTEVLNLPVHSNKKPEVTVGVKAGTKVEKAKKEISIANWNAASAHSQPVTYYLNLKIGYSDVKKVDLTPYITDKIDGLEVLVVGKEILTTPGYQEALLESEPTTGAAVSPIKAIIIIRGKNKEKVNSLAAYIRNLRPYSVYKGIGLRLQGEELKVKVVVKNKQKA